MVRDPSQLLSRRLVHRFGSHTLPLRSAEPIQRHLYCRAGWHAHPIYFPSIRCQSGRSAALRISREPVFTAIGYAGVEELMGRKVPTAYRMEQSRFTTGLDFCPAVNDAAVAPHTSRGVKAA